MYTIRTITRNSSLILLFIFCYRVFLKSHLTPLITFSITFDLRFAFERRIKKGKIRFFCFSTGKLKPLLIVHPPPIAY